MSIIWFQFLYTPISWKHAVWVLTFFFGGGEGGKGPAKTSTHLPTISIGCCPNLARVSVKSEDGRQGFGEVT